jgi:hypothetical protein
MARIRKLSQPECSSDRMHASTMGKPVQPRAHASSFAAS